MATGTDNQTCADTGNRHKLGISDFITPLSVVADALEI